MNLSSFGSGSAAQGLASAGSFPFLHRAFGQVQQNVQDRTLLCIGDSITEAVFANLGIGLVQSLARCFNGAGINSAFGLSGPANSGVTLGSDTRWANGTGWSFVTNTQPAGWGGTGCAYVGAPAAAGNLTYTPGTNSNQYDVYYFDGASPEGFTATATGGAPVVVTTGSTNTMKKATCIAAASSSANVVTLSAPTGFGCFIYGVDARLSTAATLRIGNVGSAGATSSSWISVFNASPSGASMIGVYAPDVSLIGMGINDLNTGVPVSTFLANIATLANACKVSGDVILWSDVPITPADQSIGAQAAYYAAFKAFAAANGYGYLDTFTAWGAGAKFAAMNAAGYYADNLIHPSISGDNDLGRILGQGILAL